MALQFATRDCAWNPAERQSQISLYIHAYDTQKEAEASPVSVLSTHTNKIRHY